MIRCRLDQPFRPNKVLKELSLPKIVSIEALYCLKLDFITVKLWSREKFPVFPIFQSRAQNDQILFGLQIKFIKI